jgi:nucleotide-binding universal stress UspA family protein
MYQHTLIPTDGSPLSVSAIENCMRFAHDAGAKVTVVSVVEPFHAVSSESKQLSETRSVYEKHAKASAARYLSEAERQAKTLGVRSEVVQVEHEHPYKAIIDTAAAKGCDLIAMASHGRRGVAAMLMGSETVKVLTHSSTPVLVYR